MIKPDLSHIYDYEDMIKKEKKVFKATFTMVDINVLFDEENPYGYVNTLKLI